MNNDIFYNIGKQEISKGLKDFEISSSQDYFILLSAPTDANLTIKLNSVTAHAIPIKENWSFQSKDVNKIFISCDALEDEEIIYGQADGNLILNPNPTINKVDSITNFSDRLIDRLASPFIYAGVIAVDNPTQPSAQVLDIILDCDYIEVYAFPEIPRTLDWSTSSVAFDGAIISNCRSLERTGTGFCFNESKTVLIKGTRGKRLQAYAQYGGSVTILKYNKREI